MKAAVSFLRQILTKREEGYTRTMVRRMIYLLPPDDVLQLLDELNLCKDKVIDLELGHKRLVALVCTPLRDSSPFSSLPLTHT